MHRALLNALFAGALAAALAACSGGGSSNNASTDAAPSDAASAAASPAAASDAGDTTAAIAKYVAGIDDKFAALKGDVTQKGPNPTFYASSAALPGATECFVYTYEKTDDWFGTCHFDAADQASAIEMQKTWIKNVTAAEPSWNVVPVKPMPATDVVANMARDSSNTHGAYIYVEKYGGDKYRVVTTFSTIASLAR